MAEKRLRTPFDMQDKALQILAFQRIILVLLILTIVTVIVHSVIDLVLYVP